MIVMKVKLLLLCFYGVLHTSALSQEETTSELETRVFQAYAGFTSFISDLNQDRALSLDPFGKIDYARPAYKTFREYLEDRGVKFEKGSTLIYSVKTSQFIARNTPSELEKIESILEEIHLKHAPRFLHILVEYIEVEGALYHEWMFDNRITGSGTPLRKQVQAWVKEGKGTILESLMINARSGQRAKTQGIEELIYPTEPGVPEVPNEVTLEGEEKAPVMAAASASAFETRYLGATLEVDPVLGIDNVTVDLNLGPELVRRNGLTHWPPEGDFPNLTISMPQFHKMKVTTQATIHHGEYSLLGTCRPLDSAVAGRENPVVLIFARADVGRVGPTPKILTKETNE